MRTQSTKALRKKLKLHFDGGPENQLTEEQIADIGHQIDKLEQEEANYNDAIRKGEL